MVPPEPVDLVALARRILLDLPVDGGGAAAPVLSLDAPGEPVVVPGDPISLREAVANLVNKQAFYNQFWLVGAQLLLAVAASSGALSPAVPPGRPERRSRPAGPPVDASAPPSPSDG